MKKTILTTILCAASALLLTACMTEEQADAKMAKGCAAGIGALIDPGIIKETRAQRFGNEILPEGVHRRITLDIVEENGWSEEDKTYSCLFSEQWGPMKSSHSAVLVQIDLGDQIVGKKDGTLIGELDQFMKLTETVDAAMTQ